MFDEIHVNRLLHILVFGESLLNGLLYFTVRWVLNAWFYDCVLPLSSQIVNLIIVDPIPYYRVRASLFLRIY